MKYLYGASVQGIQDFIFQSNKLKEIGGASEIVEQICTSKFLSELEKAFGENNKQFVVTDGRNIIINAAGNIKFLFEDESVCKSFVRTFPRTISEFASGITVSQAVVKFDDEKDRLTDEIDLLEASLKIQRNKTQNPSEVGLMALERSRRTGGIGISYEDNVAIDAATEQKRAAADNIRDVLNTETPNLYNKFLGSNLIKHKIPFDLNEMGKSSAKSWIAVIHADGNGLGMLVQKLAKALKEVDNERAKTAFAKFSKALDEATTTAAQKAYNCLGFDINKNRYYPIRPIILGGDDITLIIRADLSLDFTKNFLIEFEKETANKLSFLASEYHVSGFEKGLTACAGIAYIKDTYPMHYALNLAESLTKKAKKASRDKVDKGTIPPSSLAFYKVHASFVENMSAIEEKTLKAGTVSFDFGPYFTNMSFTPNINTLDSKLKVLDSFKDDKSKGVSKLRQWISELYKDKSTADFMLQRMKEVNRDFYEKMELDEAIQHEKTIIYDVLQINSLK